MFKFDGIPDARVVPWSRLEPGMIFLTGLTVNGSIPEELRDYPVLNSSTIGELRDRYKLRKDRNIRVLSPDSGGLSPRECTEAVHKAGCKVRTLNSFRGAVKTQRDKFNIGPGGALASALVRDDSLILPYGDRRRQPTLLSRLDFSLDVADLFLADFRRKFIFPEDRRMEIHLVVDYSYSMKASGRDIYAHSALNLFYTGLKDLFTEATFRLYGFSDDCRKLEYPVIGDEVSRKETRFSSFLDEVLWNADESVPSVVILFTDGLPTDRQKTMIRLAMAKGRGIDYMQVVFNIEGDKRELAEGSGQEVLDGYITDDSTDSVRLSDDAYRKLIRDIRRDFGELAEAAGGGQVILNIDEALALVSVEGFDQWVGSLGSR